MISTDMNQLNIHIQVFLVCEHLSLYFSAGLDYKQFLVHFFKIKKNFF